MSEPVAKLYTSVQLVQLARDGVRNSERDSLQALAGIVFSALALKAIVNELLDRIQDSDALVRPIEVERLIAVASAADLHERTVTPQLEMECPADRIIDELGYLSHAVDAANVLYSFINDRYLQRRLILLTTNKPLASLGDVVHDGDLVS